MLEEYEKNINYLLNLEKKDKYDKLTKYAIGSINKKEIFTTEFLMAKQLGYIDKFVGHKELKEYLKLLPFIFNNNVFVELFINFNNHRKLFSLFDGTNRRIFHVIDDENYLVSVYLVNIDKYKRQLDKKFRKIKNLNGGTVTPHILSPAEPFWRHLDLLDELYQNLKNMSNKPKELNTIGRYWRKKYNEKVYKIPISISGFTCPNIDGTIAYGGCTFCENDSFAPNLQKEKNSTFKLHPNNLDNPLLQNQLIQLENQFQTTRNKLIKKFGASKFIVYFQSFTNTYAPSSTLKTLYEKALSFDDVVGLSIGTRADSITDEVLEYLQELNQTKEIWVEYGIQSVYDTTLEKINRGENFNIIKNIILKTKQMGLNVCGHLIFGLPNETQDMMIQSVKQSIDLGIDSIKFHPLYVVKNTILTKDFKDGAFVPISEKLYIDTLVKSIKLLPKNVSISRVSAGISDDSLLSPSWCKDKYQQMSNIKKALLINNFIY